MPLEKERGHKGREITQVSSRGVIVSRDLRWQRSLWPSEGFELSARSKSSSRLALGLLLDRGSKQSQRFPNWMKGGRRREDKTIPSFATTDGKAREDDDCERKSQTLRFEAFNEQGEEVPSKKT